MFRMRQSLVEATDTGEAIRLLGWGACVSGPVAFSGVRFWAGVRVDNGEHERRRQAGIGPVLARDVLAGHIESGMGPRTLRPSGCSAAWWPGTMRLQQRAERRCSPATHLVPYWFATKRI
jgi:hypothetical protein